jgi:hypothetical protein
MSASLSSLVSLLLVVIQVHCIKCHLASGVVIILHHHHFFVEI